MNALRLLALTASLCALLVWWVFHYRFAWVAQLDVWICDKHIEDVREFHEQYKAQDWTDPALQDHASDFLSDLEPIQHRDRRYPLWLKNVSLLVAGLRTSGDLDRAVEWQSKVFRSHPQNLDQTLLWTDLLVQRATPQDQELAGTELASLMRRFPDWAEPIMVDLRREAAANGWGPRTFKQLNHWSKLASEVLAQDWQWYYWLQEPEGVQKSDIVDAHWVPENANYRLRFEVPPGGLMKRFRVDAIPNSQGRLRDLRLTAFDAAGKETQLKVRMTRGVDWNAEENTLQLTATPDPQIIIDPPPHGTLYCDFEFSTQPLLPDWIQKDSGNDPGLRAFLEQNGWQTGVGDTGAPEAGDTGTGANGESGQ